MEKPIPWLESDALAFQPGLDDGDPAAAPEPGEEEDESAFWDNMIFPV